MNLKDVILQKIRDKAIVTVDKAEVDLLRRIAEHNEKIKDGGPNVSEAAVRRHNMSLRRSQSPDAQEAQDALDRLTKALGGDHETCPMCGGEFGEDKVRSKYCSSTCSINSRNLQMQLYAQAHKAEGI